MQVKQRLRLNSIFVAFSAIAVTIVLFLTMYHVNRAIKADELADAIVTASFERLLLETDNLRTGNERSKIQLIAKHKQLGQLLERALKEFPNQEDKKTIRELLVLHDSMASVSGSIRHSRETVTSEPPPPVSLESRLISQLNMRVYEAILLDSKLQRSSSKALLSALRHGGTGIVMALMLVAMVTFVNSITMSRTITDRVRKLQDGSLAMGHGQLDYRIDIQGDDEFVTLANSFNAMGAKLSASYREVDEHLLELNRQIAERKQAEEALRESEERVRRKLESILTPEGNIDNLDLADIIDPAPMQSLMENFYRLTNLPVALIDLKGKVLVGVGWQDICTQFHRQNPESCKNCVESDTILTSGVAKGTFKVYKCKNNMWDVATPIIVGDRHFGNFFMGQFFFDDEPVDYDLFRCQAQAYGFDEEAYLNALARVPRMNRPTLETGMAYFIELANLISRMSYSNLKLSRSLSERDTLMASLRASEAAAHNRTAELAAIMDALPVGVAIVDKVGGNVRSNSAFERIWKGPRPKTDSIEDYDAYKAWWADSDRPVKPEEWASARAIQKGETVVGQLMRIRRFDGTHAYIHNSAAPIQDPSGETLGSAVALMDITGLRSAEETAKYNMRRFALLAETSARLLTSEAPQQIVDELCRKVMQFLDCEFFFNFIAEEEGYLSLNACAGIPAEEAEKITRLDYGIAVCGCAARDACRIVAEDIQHNRDPRTDLVKSYGVQAYACHPLMAGTQVIGTLSFGTSTRPSFTDDELSLMAAVAGQVAIAMERKKSEEILSAAKVAAEEANKAKSQFLANMSHELRTPMTGVLGMLQLALETRLDPLQQEYLDTAYAASRSLLHILNDILDLTRVEKGILFLDEKPFSVKKCLAETVELLKPEAHRKGLKMNGVVTDDVPETVLGDQVRVRQVLTNLMGNAIKFTQSGSVQVKIGATSANADRKRELIFTVADTGIGIPENKKDSIFRSFSQVDESHTRRYGGTGLGLAISREVVELMGGTLTVESKEGKGSCFRFTIPCVVAESPNAEEPVAATKVSDPASELRLRLLVVEDDATTRQVLSRMLARSHDIEMAEDGHKAVEMWEKGDYDLILMDVQMPDLDGFAATAAIRETERRSGRKPTLIIAMTAHTFKEDEERCLAAGMDAYIAKPIDINGTLQTIQELALGAHTHNSSSTAPVTGPAEPT